MKSNPTTVLKIPKGLYKEANVKGVKTQLLFYYRLKQLKVDGSWRKKGVVGLLVEDLKITAKIIRKRIEELKELGWIREAGNYYELVSYDKMWSSIGIEVNDKKRFSLIKIDSHLNFQQQIYYQEIKQCLKKQEREIKKNYIKKRFGVDAAKNKRLMKVVKVRSKDLQEAIYHQQQIIRQSLSSFVEYNFENTITCLKTAQLLGYKTAMQGWLIQKELETEGILKVQSRKHSPLFVNQINKQAFKKLNLDNSFFLTKEGYLFKNLPNLLTPIL